MKDVVTRAELDEWEEHCIILDAKRLLASYRQAMEALRVHAPGCPGCDDLISAYDGGQTT